jgi:phosphomannomutase
MSIDPGIFKAYDIRGIYPDQLNSDLATQIGRAFVDYLCAKQIAVGRDARLSSPELAAAFIEGARDHGCHILDIGVVATDMLYFAVGQRDLDGGAVITASHNPKEWNGLKLVRRGALPLSGDAGIKEIREGILAGRYTTPGSGGAPAPEVVDIQSEYSEHCLSFIDASLVPRLKVVLDTGNGSGAVAAGAIFDGLPLETVKLHFELDGTFPNHPPDPLQEENRRELAECVLEEKADLGIAWDGDADRCFFIDDRGAFVPGDFVTALLGERFCALEPGARIVYDVRASRAVPDTITAAGGVPLIHRVGHAFIKRRMRDEDAIFGGEVSGHYYFRDNWFADNGMIPALLLLELLGKSGKRLSELVSSISDRYHISGEINSRVSDIPAALERLEKRYADAEITRLDGISVDYADWHFNVRASNTEPLLRLNLEAFEREAMQERRDEVLAVIRGV